MLRDCDIRELQADELCTFIRQQEQTHVAVCDHRGVFPLVGRERDDAPLVGRFQRLGDLLRNGTLLDPIAPNFHVAYLIASGGETTVAPTMSVAERSQHLA